MSEQDERDERMLQRLILQELPKRSRFQLLNKFFSHPAWQGAGAIIGLLSLAVTVILTVYVFDLGRQQELAQMHYDPTTGGVFIVNIGPATAKDVLVVITAPEDIKCANSEPGFSPYEITSPKITVSHNRCEFYYESFYTNGETFIRIKWSDETKNDPFEKLPVEVYIVGLNVTVS